MDKGKTTKLLNLTGLFFQDYCATVLSSLTGFATKTEEPFTFPPSNGPLIGLAGSIDVLAVYSDSRKSICFSVECKRALPSTKNWVFFRRREQEKQVSFVYKPGGPLAAATVVSRLSFPKLGYTSLSDFELCDRTIELDEKFEKLNKTAGEKTYRALLQAHHGLLPCIIEKSPEINAMCNGSKQPMIFLPVVLTTANLHVANFDPKQVSPETGEVSPADIEYEQKQWVEFEFGLPDYLVTYLKTSERRSTFVVNSQSIAEFFQGAVSPSGL